jgi:hypothetical protein
LIEEGTPAAQGVSKGDMAKRKQYDPNVFYIWDGVFFLSYLRLRNRYECSRAAVSMKVQNC